MSTKISIVLGKTWHIYRDMMDDLIHIETFNPKGGGMGEDIEDSILEAHDILAFCRELRPEAYRKRYNAND